LSIAASVLWFPPNRQLNIGRMNLKGLRIMEDEEAASFLAKMGVDFINRTALTSTNLLALWEFPPEMPGIY